MRPVRTRPSWRALQIVALGAFAWYAARALRGQWHDVATASRSLDPIWALVFASGCLVLATYALLIEVWRRLVGSDGTRLPFSRAATIWFVSSLGKYAPGKVWAIVAMGALAQRAGVSAGAATLAALLNQAVNLAAGFALLALVGLQTMRLMVPDVTEDVATGVAVLAAVALVILPLVLPRAVAAAARRSQRFGTVRIPSSLLWMAVIANVAGWATYGLAFHVLAHALLLDYGGTITSSIAVFTGSYILGYLAVFAPGGLFVREAAVVAALTGLGIATLPQATVLALASRLWLTVLEIVPGALLLAREAVSRHTRSPI